MGIRHFECFKSLNIVKAFDYQNFSKVRISLEIEVVALATIHVQIFFFYLENFHNFAELETTIVELSV